MNSLTVGYYGSDELLELGFASVGKNVFLAKNCHVLNPHRIHLGSEIKIHPYCSLVAYENSSIAIDTSVHIGGYSLLFALRPITIGAFSSISTHVRLFTASDDFSGESLLGCNIPSELRIEKIGEIQVGRHCGIGTGAAMLPGARLNEGCVLGAQSLLKAIETKPWSTYAGVPALFVRERSRRSLGLAERFQGGESF